MTDLKTMSQFRTQFQRSAFYVIAIGFSLVIGAAAWRFSSSASPPVIDSSRLTIEKTDTQVEHKLAIRIRNTSWRTIQIVGCKGNGCGPGGCVYGIEPEYFEIPPGGTKETLVHYQSPPIAGPFEKEFSIFSATNTLNEHKLKVTGVAVAAKKKETDHQDSKSKKEKPEEPSDVSNQDS